MFTYLMKRRKSLALGLSLITLLCLPPTASMQQGGPYTLKPTVIAGGGKSSSNGTSAVTSSIGQPLTGTSSGGAYRMDSGFWNAAVLCLSLSKNRQSFNASGGIGTVEVKGSTACAWTAVSNDPSFITITSGTGGSGDGTVTYSVSANSSTSSRAGSLTIANQTVTVLQGASFLDVPPGHPFYDVIGKLSASGVTSGCGGGNYCPDGIVTREQMAAFLIKSLGINNPPTPGSQRFNDVPPANPFYAFIEQMAVLQITSGCSSSPPLYCPTDSVSREQMAAFLIKALHPPGYVPPPPAQQRFNDVPPTNLFYAHIEEMAVRGITSGCSASPPLYCPAQLVSRAQMAAFLVKAFNL